MKFKISLAGLKARWKDYLVLFSGMLMTTAIFYMFEAVSTNNAFTTASRVGQNAKFVFIFGSVLLSLITIVYIFYANNFLMSMRKHDYGLFMMLGAKPSVISRLIMTETLIIGVGSTVIGIILGWGLTKGISGLLVSQLDITLTHFHALYVPAIRATFILFIILFLIAGSLNAITFFRTSALQLLKSQQQSDWKPAKKLILAIEALLGVALLAGGYYAMYDIEELKIMSIPIGLVTIVLGTYFVFNSFFIMLLTILQRSSIGKKGLNSFTIAQLKFRIKDYTKILSVVSLLFALALGAITVGIGFQQMAPKLAAGNSPYALALTNPTYKMRSMINNLDHATQTTYQQKVVGKTVYYRQQQLKAQPLKYAYFKSNDVAKAAVKSIGLNELRDPQSEEYLSAQRLQAPQFQSFQLKAVSDDNFSHIQAQPKQLLVVAVTDMNSQSKQLTKIFNLESQRTSSKYIEMLPGSFSIYQQVKGIFASVQFMGIFLGIAFLAMLASCLMFKILSGTTTDKRRFEMLNKIGTKKSALRHSIMIQVFGLFGLPAILGLIDVAFGLQMFEQSNMLYGSYQIFSWSAIAFVVLYLIYYGLTVLIYSRIVVPRTKVEK
ncbi:FtsX-like permease family protein [Lentilactobacillus diolivorans]|uniref:FtsX-like permease family protein n=1 Tax=Lentilactobacillus diolivorans TaxID=179838 RepID=UPI0024683081|nr:FtsX-like permease family protein [Lentilactobacillus diolivorans]MDH5104346.1 FtsX-like permease family protein [Lentilactobacillus diolivorans]